MKVFDFDNTLYHGESSIDFALFLIKNNKRIILWLPTIFWNLIKYKLCLVSRNKMERTINDFLKVIITDKSDLLRMAELFWSKHGKKLDHELISRIESDDVIITAGPEFLIEAIKAKLGTSHLLCSQIDYENKSIICLNFGDNKVRRYRGLYGRSNIDAFYTDSYNDKALMEISQRVFLVHKGKVRQVK